MNAVSEFIQLCMNTFEKSFFAKLLGPNLIAVGECNEHESAPRWAHNSHLSNLRSYVHHCILHPSGDYKSSDMGMLY